MDLNMVVLGGELAGNPSIEKHWNSDLNRLELIVRTVTRTDSDIKVEALNRVHWSGVTNDELLTEGLVKGDRVWVAGYVVSDGEYLDHTAIHALQVQKWSGSFDDESALIKEIP